MNADVRLSGSERVPPLRSAVPVPPKRRARRDWIGYAYLAPALVFYGVFVVVPILQSLQISFYDYNGLSVAKWVGLDNYLAVLTDGRLLEALSHSFVFLLFYSVLPVALGLLLAGLMSRIRIYGLTAFRALLFLPQILSTVVVAVAWRGIYDIDGPINEALRAIGLGDLARAWIGDFDSALPSVGLVGTWIEYGLCMVLFLAGIAAIDREMYEAARLDGAGAVREFFSLTVPSLRPQIIVALILTVTFALRNFDIVWNTTRGGPGTSTTVPSVFVYQFAFQSRDIGLASALAIALTVVTLAVVGVVLLLGRERDTKGGRRARRAS